MCLSEMSLLLRSLLLDIDFIIINLLKRCSILFDNSLLIVEKMMKIEVDKVKNKHMIYFFVFLVCFILLVCAFII